MATTFDNHRPQTITKLLQDWHNGDQAAFSVVFERVYNELRRIANNLLSSESKGFGLQATGVVNEVYQSLSRKQEIDWDSRRHFFNVAAKAMRYFIIEEARKNKAQKRGGDMREIQLEESMVLDQQPDPDDLITLDKILNELETSNPVGVRIVELRFFVGCTIEEAANILDLSTATVKRKWDFAKVQLYNRLAGHKK
jgi:RNA polymerase sigma factor (TIGR02999 family)